MTKYQYHVIFGLKSSWNDNPSSMDPLFKLDIDPNYYDEQFHMDLSKEKVRILNINFYMCMIYIIALTFQLANVCPVERVEEQTELDQTQKIGHQHVGLVDVSKHEHIFC